MVSRTIIYIDDKLVDLGGQCTPLKAFISAIRLRNSERGDYTFGWFSMTRGIANVPVPIHIKDLPFNLNEKDLDNKQLLLCKLGSLLYKATHREFGDVVVKYACEQEREVPLIVEYVNGLKIPRMQHVAKYYGMTDGTGLVSEYFCGEPLNKFFINSHVSTKVKQQCLATVGELHRRGIYHGDLKPENILVNQHNIRIIDFASCYKDGWMQPDVYGTKGYTINNQELPNRENDEYAINKIVTQSY